MSADLVMCLALGAIADALGGLVRQVRSGEDALPEEASGDA